MDNVKEFRSLESRLERIENALIAGGLLQAPPMPRLESPEMVPFTLVEKPVLTSPFGQPRYSQAGVEFQHCDGKVQCHRINFIGLKVYDVACSVCGKRLQVDLRGMQ
jgi:hypothetical protein